MEKYCQLDNGTRTILGGENLGKISLNYFGGGKLSLETSMEEAIL
jgi:hypothetical protein